LSAVFIFKRKSINAILINIYVRSRKRNYNFFIQKPKSDIRYRVNFLWFDGEKIKWNILDEEKYLWNKNEISLYIAISNKSEKNELIVQKLSEIWVNYIYFFGSERSQVHEINDKKLDRLNKISLEAVEQSFWFVLPEIEFINNVEISKIECDYKFFLEMWFPDLKSDLKNIEQNKICLFVWPEGWRTEKEITNFKSNWFTWIWLWNTVLRMETAAIVGAWYLKNHL
jgi:RsmE family RNA methyltransferase